MWDVRGARQILLFIVRAVANTSFAFPRAACGAFGATRASCRPVNFFGHAAVASWYDLSPAFVLGAMLPDFLAMLRLSPPPQEQPDISAGIALHHATDAVFHESASFIALTAAARQELAKLGIARGPARAVAHVGVELLLDDTLATPKQHRSAYLSALALASREPWPVLLRSAADGERLRALLLRLGERGVPEPALASAGQARRIHHMLRGRPRLEFPESGLEPVTAWLETARPEVAREAPRLVSELRAALDGTWRGRPRASATKL